MAVVNTGFDPAFGDPLRKLIERARAEGYDASLISGVRDDEDQRQLVANAAATRAGQPLPYPKRGPVRVAAPVGYSPHEYGTASDVKGVPQAELSRLAAPLGLNTIPGDPGHIELANWRREAANQPPPTPWSEVNPANVPTREAMAVSSSVPGTSINTTTPSSQDVLSYARQRASAYGIDPNTAAQFVTKESSGQADAIGDKGSSFGPLQLHYGGINPAMPKPGMGDEFTQRTGLDARDPATWQQQIDFGLSQAKQTGWQPWQTTMNKLGLDRWSGIDAAAAVGPGPGNVGPVTGFLPGQPTGAVGIGADVNAKAPAAPAPPAGGGFMGKLAGALGKAADAANADQPQAPQGNAAEEALSRSMQQSQQFGAQHAQQVSAMSAQKFLETMAQAAKPLSWGSQSPGAGQIPGQGYGPKVNATDPQQLLALLQQGQAQDPMLGLTLNSMGGLNG